MALMHNPQLLFLDEPTLGLDPQARRVLWDYIATLKGQKTILLTTHYMEEADALSDRVAIVDEGQIVSQGTPAELKATLQWTARYFDTRSPDGSAMLAGLKRLAASSISVELPDLSPSLQAVRNYRLTREKAAR